MRRFLLAFATILLLAAPAHAFNGIVLTSQTISTAGGAVTADISDFPTDWTGAAYLVIETANEVNTASLDIQVAGVSPYGNFTIFDLTPFS